MQERAVLPGVSRDWRPTDPLPQGMTGTALSMSFLIDGGNGSIPPWSMADLFYRTQRRMIQAVSARLPGPGMVLDMGGGTGRFARLQQARPEMSVVGLQSSTPLPATYRCRATLDVSRVLMTAFPHDDGRFDAVMSSMSFHRWADKPAALREVARLLRPGGVLALADFSADDVVGHTLLLRGPLGSFTSRMAPLADRHRWLELTGLRLLYVIPTLMERHIFMTIAERPAASSWAL